MTNRQNSNNELYYTVLRFDMKYFFVTARNLSDRARARARWRTEFNCFNDKTESRN